MSREDRKTSYHEKRQFKPSESDIHKLFKSLSATLRSEASYFSNLICNPLKNQSILASALNNQSHKECLE